MPRVLTWTVEDKMHHLIADVERAFVEDCLDILNAIVVEAGGIESYMDAECPARADLLGKPKEGATPKQVLIASLEAILQRNARTGGETVHVEQGYLLSSGMKKVMKLEMQCVDQEPAQMSICWAWDVKLENQPSG